MSVNSLSGEKSFISAFSPDNELAFIVTGSFAVPLLVTSLHNHQLSAWVLAAFSLTHTNPIVSSGKNHFNFCVFNIHTILQECYLCGNWSSLQCLLSSLWWCFPTIVHTFYLYTHFGGELDFLWSYLLHYLPLKVVLAVLHFSIFIWFLPFDLPRKDLPKEFLGHCYD